MENAIYFLQICITKKDFKNYRHPTKNTTLIITITDTLLLATVNQLLGSTEVISNHLTITNLRPLLTGYRMKGSV